MLNRERVAQQQEDQDIERMYMERLEEKKQADKEFEDNMNFIEELVYGKK